ncbi:MAG: hypothetical protein GY863_02270 [bacterium]|nr:hypothetical protein [bacterium]
MFLSNLITKLLYGISLIIITPLILLAQTGITDISEDSLSFNKFYQKKFQLSNSEEFADGFFSINDLQHLDLGAIGQFSGMSFRGTNYRNLIPVLNGVPIESVSYGAPDLFNIPNYVIDNVSLNEKPGLNFPGIYKPVYIQSKKNKRTVPFSRFEYKFGDYAYNHVDVTLSRYFTENLSVFASGSKEDFPDKFQDNEMHGSKYWLDMNYKFRQWNLNWLTFVSDYSVNYNSTLPVSDSDTTDFIKDTHRGSNFKFFNLQIKNDSLEYSPEISLYYWSQNEQSSDSTFFHRKFKNRENVLGVLGTGAIPEPYDQLDLYYRLNFQRSDVNGGFWPDDVYYKSRLSLTLNHKLSSKVNLTVSPELTWMTDQNVCFYNLFEVGYLPSDRLSTKFAYRRSGRYASLSEKYFSHPNILGINQPVPDNELMDNVEFDLVYKFNTGIFRVNPYFVNYESTLYSGFGITENGVVRDSDGYIGNITNYGINFDYKQYLNRHIDYKLSYNLFSSDRTGSNPVNSASFQVNLRYLEDLITSKNVDTEINISGKFIQKRDALNYLPLYRLFAYTNSETPSIGIFKVRGCAYIRDISIFQEIDLYTNEDYQRVLGYKRARQLMVRIGVSWNFYN